METKQEKFEYLKEIRTINLTTFYKSGKSVATPVQFAHHEGKLYVSTRKNSYKVKRIKNNSNGLIAPCTMKGKEIGPQIEVRVRILPKTEEYIAVEALKEDYSGVKEEVVFLEIV